MFISLVFHLIFITANANCPNILDLCYSFLPNSQVFSTCIFLIVWTNKLAWLEHGDNVAKITGLMSCLWLCIRKWNKIRALRSYKNCLNQGSLIHMLSAWFEQGGDCLVQIHRQSKSATYL